MRTKIDLSGFWNGKLELNPDIDVAVPEIIERDFYVPLSWNMQIKDLQWPSEQQELSAITRPIQNQNFRDRERKFSEGTISYRKKVVLKKKAGMDEFLVFEGSNFKTIVYINGNKVGENKNGHLKFEFDISDYTVDGENEFLVIVDNLRDKNVCPQEQFNWKNYGGIYRPFYIEYRPEINIHEYLVLTKMENGKWYADVSVSLNKAAYAELLVAISSGASQKETKITFNNSKSESMRIPFDNPAIWSPGNPQLSEIKLTLFHDNKASDELSGNFGFRTVETRGRDILINGEKFMIMGASFHEQHPAFGNSVPGWQWENDLRLLKHCGLNAVRAAHYPYSKEFYDACDREGVVCVAELPCWQFNEYHSTAPGVLEFCSDYAKKMIQQLGNHPSIIGWVVQNESKTFEPGVADFFTALNSVFKNNDSSRFTLTAENPDPPEHLAVIKQVKGSPAKDVAGTAKVIDIYGINDYSGWYGEKAGYLSQLLDHVGKKVKNRPVVMTEFGGEATQGKRSLTMEHYSEDYQAELISHHLKEILKRDFISGFFIWLFFDYEGSSISILGINAKGIVDSQRNPKLGFNAVKNIIQEHRHSIES